MKGEPAARVGPGRRSPGPVWLEHNIHYAKCRIRQIWAFVGSAWQWLGLWLGSLTATTETPQIPQLSARISPQGRPRFPDLPQRCP
ncbi:hypothetical protein FEO93_10300 [Stenotrophomonas maltophilia]|nr:hypothetical protein FEO93_10300 [Stenotrophomonas maltophilia]